eukprot:SAG22_NODE_2349_length_2681_cov_20.618900_1_plen_210_part_00
MTKPGWNHMKSGDIIWFPLVVSQPRAATWATHHVSLQTICPTICPYRAAQKPNDIKLTRPSVTVDIPLNPKPAHKDRVDALTAKVDSLESKGELSASQIATKAEAHARQMFKRQQRMVVAAEAKKAEEALKKKEGGGVIIKGTWRICGEASCGVQDLCLNAAEHHLMSTRPTARQWKLGIGLRRPVRRHWPPLKAGRHRHRLPPPPFRP